MSQNLQKITLAAGCFWCIEAAFNQLKGVVSAVSGYTDGETFNPTYEDICTGNSGHAEAVEITFNEDEISINELLVIYFTLHDPTQLNRQGNDIGSQYRSAIFYHTDKQKDAAANMIEQLTAQKIWPAPIVTVIKKASMFYPAEAYHQNYVNNNLENPYCQLVVRPKLRKFKQQHQKQLKVLN